MCLAVSVGSPSLLLAQQESMTITSVTSSDLTKHKTSSRLTRWEINVGTGFTAGVLTGIPQTKPVLQTNLGYAVNTRLSLGLAYGRVEFNPSAFRDKNGVVSQETSFNQHYGARLKGVFLRKQIVNLYGGVQLGVTTARQTYTHVFPSDFVVEDQAAYLSDRATPFFAQGPQVGVIGFMGVCANLLPHLAAYAELGNNLALVSGGVTAKF